MVVRKLSDLAFMAGTQELSDLVGRSSSIEMESKEVAKLLGARVEVGRGGADEAQSNRDATGDTHDGKAGWRLEGQVGGLIWRSNWTKQGAAAMNSSRPFIDRLGVLQVN